MPDSFAPSDQDLYGTFEKYSQYVQGEGETCS